MKDGSRRYERAHRSAWRIYRGQIPYGLFVCHHCDVRSCVNPEHLFVGTALENTADMFRKKRQNPPKHWPQMERRADGTWKPIKDGDRAPS
ncbi:MAG: HNH endonuclease signature motif containing protein [Methylocella sp.]